MSDKGVFKKMYITRDKEDYFIMMKVSHSRNK